MNHFSTEIWADFARGVLPQKGATRLESHLGRCHECQDTYKMWQVVVDFGRREKSYTPGDDAVRRAKGAIRLAQAWKMPRLKVLAQLISDTFRQPVFGVRNSMPAVRHLNYESGPLLIDIGLRMNSQAAEKPVFVVGQVLNSDRPDERITGFRVSLLRGRRFLAQTTASELGEFHFELAEGKNWKLVFEIENEEAIQLSLPDLTSGLPKSGD
jgi:hypothetical protein